MIDGLNEIALGFRCWRKTEMRAARRGGRFFREQPSPRGTRPPVDRRHASLASAIGASRAAAVAR